MGIEEIITKDEMWCLSKFSPWYHSKYMENSEKNKDVDTGASSLASTQITFALVIQVVFLVLFWGDLSSSTYILNREFPYNWSSELT